MYMRIITWLLDIANKKPLLFSTALLLVMVITLVTVVRYEEKQNNSCQQEMAAQQVRYDAKIDSLTTYYIKREINLNDEVKQTLNIIITGYKNQLEQQQQLNATFIKTLEKKARK